MSPVAVDEAIQAVEIPGLVELFDLDLTPISAGAPVLHFVADTAPTQMIQRGGVRYYPVPLESEGFDRGGTGAVPQPILRVGDVLGQIGPWVWTAQDIVGATVTRTVVFRAHLDDGTDPDATASILLDVYTIEQKLSQTAQAIEFRLVAQIDQGRKQLPGRQVVRDTCQNRYRVWDGAAWDYSKATCPYTGLGMWDVTDAVTAVQSEDLCSKKLTGCTIRFPAPVALPTTAFPGVGRYR